MLVMVITKSNNHGWQIRLLPNRSASWRQIRYVVAAIGGLSLAIAIFWAFQGAWVILPFAGIEVALLVFFSYRVSSAVHHQEIIYVDDQHIRVEWGQSFPKRQWAFKRNEAEFVITRPRHSLSAAEVELKSGEQEKRLGSQLNKEDIDELIEWIRQSGITYRFTGQTTTVAIDGFDLS